MTYNTYLFGPSLKQYLRNLRNQSRRPAWSLSPCWRLRRRWSRSCVPLCQSCFSLRTSFSSSTDECFPLWFCLALSRIHIWQMHRRRLQWLQLPVREKFFITTAKAFSWMIIRCYHQLWKQTLVKQMNTDWTTVKIRFFRSRDNCRAVYFPLKNGKTLSQASEPTFFLTVAPGTMYTYFVDFFNLIIPNLTIL